MNLEHYSYFSNNDYLDYEFYSDGPKGRIKKVVRFTKIAGQDLPVYNLGFGDAGEKVEIINDNVVTNNQDREKVLATLANIVI